ncbi:aspartic proteinase-like protein 2 [Pistacia vera]|uniref:aspartic proteinase-like protein 2 n=1 Tax=Pistacia vera TaxID=55513 RepID=UPI001263BEB9|nr:aspartic proteinase-like protein 2 [Pistacia vera]
MEAFFSLGVMIAFMLLFHVGSVLSHFPTTLTLERAIPPSHQLQLAQLIARDRKRHGRLLQSSGGVVDFPVAGTFDPFLVGLYYTKVQLGSPPREFNVQIDTGSDVLWVSCSSCNGCPGTSGLQIQLNFFDPQSSSTASLVSCSDPRCSLGLTSADSVCSSQKNQCGYTFQYGDGSGTSGYYVADLLHLDTIVQGSVNTNSSSQIVFGCSTLQTGDLTKSDRAVDGIFGFGQQGMSVISQLASSGLTPRVFSHCLKGDSAGGGILVLGEIVEPNIVYSPLVQSQPHYNLNLQSISVNGQPLDVNPSVFATSSNKGTIVDTGTTLAYLTADAYDPLVNAITSSVLQPVRSILSKGNQCFIVTTSIAGIFPQVSFNFAGGASLVLNPQDYLIQQNSVGGAAVWCIGFQKIQGQTILGDLVLKDKIVVYDLAGQRIGWANYDCSMSVNVSTATNTGRSEYVNAGQLSGDTAPRPQPHKLIQMNMIAFLLHILMLGRFVLL